MKIETKLNLNDKAYILMDNGEIYKNECTVEKISVSVGDLGVMISYKVKDETVSKQTNYLSSMIDEKNIFRSKEDAAESWLLKQGLSVEGRILLMAEL